MVLSSMLLNQMAVPTGARRTPADGMGSVVISVAVDATDYGDSSDDDSDRSASPTNRRQAVQDRQSRCLERRRRSHRREVNQQSSAAERQNVSQAHEMHSSVWHTGTPRERFGFTVGAKLGTYDGSPCLETFIARFNNCARYIKWD